MDPNRFDHVAKSLARRLTRRGVLASAGVGGLATAALGAAPSRAQDGSITCVYDFDGTIDVGPSSTIVQNNTVAGELTFTIGPDGAIDAGTLVRANGDAWHVVGQATGRAINLRISVPNTGAFIAIGTARHNLVNCPAAMAGPASGPLRRDAGSWTATVKQGSGTTTAAPTAVPTEPSGPVNTGNPPPQPTATPSAAASPEIAAQPSATVACQLICGADTLGPDPASCSCLCPDGTTLCVTQPHSSHAKGGVIFQPSVANPLGFCVDLTSDVSNCGACFTACGDTTPACVDGICVAS